MHNIIIRLLSKDRDEGYVMMRVAPVSLLYIYMFYICITFFRFYTYTCFIHFYCFKYV